MNLSAAAQEQDYKANQHVECNKRLFSTNKKQPTLTKQRTMRLTSIRPPPTDETGTATDLPAVHRAR